MAATTKLIVWNQALLEIGDHPLADTTTASATQRALNDSWDHAVEYVLARRDWNFARRRAQIAGTTSSAYPPFTRVHTKPADYLRKVWFKAAADDEFQIPHAEVGASIYSHVTTGLLEYISDHADNYNPANWPPQFTRVLALYLAMLVAVKVGRTGADDVRSFVERVEAALAEAERSEAVSVINEAIPADRLPVLRRAMELLGQPIAGSLPSFSDADQLRWQMNRGWTQAVTAVLEQAPWNFALRRAALTATADTTTFPPYTNRFDRPAGFLKRVWIREQATDTFEADYAEAGTYVYGYAGTKVMEYIAQDSAALTATNWPQAFSELVALYLAAHIAPLGQPVQGPDGTTMQPAGSREGLMQQFAAQLELAKASEAVQQFTRQIPAARFPVMRRALELMGQSLTGFVVTDEMTSRMRWQMNLGWDHAVRTVLSEGAWNFATKRALFQNGDDGDANVPSNVLSGLDEGYSVEPASASTAATPIAGYDYSFPLPDDFLHKIWIKAAVSHDIECPHQVMGDHLFVNYDPVLMEYVAEDAFTTDPANWPPSFLDAVAAFLGLSVAPELSVETGRRGARVAATGLPSKMQAVYAQALSVAKTKDAIQQYPEAMPLGNFARARFGGLGYGRAGRRLH